MVLLGYLKLSFLYQTYLHKGSTPEPIFLGEECLSASHPVGLSTAKQHGGEGEAKGVVLKPFHRGLIWFPSYLHTYPWTRIWGVVQDELYYKPNSLIQSSVLFHSVK